MPIDIEDFKNIILYIIYVLWLNMIISKLFLSHYKHIYRNDNTGIYTNMRHSVQTEMIGLNKFIHKMGVKGPQI